MSNSLKRDYHVKYPVNKTATGTKLKQYDRVPVTEL